MQFIDLVHPTCHSYMSGNVSGHSETGASNERDFYTLLLCGIIHLKSFPKENGTLDMVPVDFVVKAMGKVSTWTLS